MMKKQLLLTAFVLTMPLTMMAQVDDMYFVPKKSAAKVKVQDVAADNVPAYYVGSNRDVDEYNRRGHFRSSYQTLGPDSIGSDIIDFMPSDGLYPDSTYVAPEDMVFSSPSYGSDFDEDDYLYSRRLSRFDGFYDPWFYSYYHYSPFWYSRWGWYDPWYSGWYDPWYYGYYTGWYDPWYWGSWGWPYYGGYWGSYYYRHGGWYPGGGRYISGSYAHRPNYNGYGHGTSSRPTSSWANNGAHNSPVANRNQAISVSRSNNNSSSSVVSSRPTSSFATRSTSTPVSTSVSRSSGFSGGGSVGGGARSGGGGGGGSHFGGHR